MATKSRPGAANLVRGRFARRAGLGGSLVPSAPLGTNQPTLADLAPYAGVSVGGYTRYENVPWGALFGVTGWNEPTLNGRLVQPVMTIYMPNTPAPAGGYGMILRAHANGADHNIEEGTGSLWANLVVPAMQGGYGVCSIEFRHPVPNVALGAPHLDAGYCVQLARALGPALNLNQNRFHAYCTSRGNLVFWQAVAPELADPGSPAFAKRQSSRVKAVYGVQTQDSYSTTQFIQQKVVPADQAACLADPAYADDPRWGSAQDLIRNGQQPLPYLCAVYDQPFVNALPSHVMGRYTKAQIDADMNLRVHCPEFARGLWDAFAARGRTDLITVCDEVSGGVATTADAVGFFTAIDTQPGISAKAAKCQAQQRRLGGTLHYFEGASPSGAYASQSTPTPVTTAGATFGVLIDGAWGRDNRLNTSAPLGATMVQNTAAARPTLTPINRGLGLGFSLDVVDDVFRVGLANASVDVLSFPVLEAPVQGFTTRGTGQVTLGADKLGAKTLSLIAAVPNTVFSAVDAKFLRQFALELSGEDRFGALDKVTTAGGRYLLDDRTRYVRPGLSFARAQQVFGVQADGSMTAYTGAQVPWEAQGVRLDPGWVQYAASPTDVTNAAWAKTRCTAEAVTAAHPFGGSSMSLIREDTSNNSHFFQSTVLTSVVGASYTARAIVYPAGRTHIAFVFTGAGGSDRGVFVNLVTGQVTGAFASFPARYGARLRPDGGVEVFIGETVSAAAGYAARVYLGSGTNTTIYQGDGTSGIRLAVLNHTNTDYEVPFVSSAVTVPAFSFSGLLADMGITLGSEYTLIATYRLANLTTDYQPLVFSLSNGTFNESVYLNAATTIAGRPSSMSVVDGGVGQATAAGFGPNAAVGVRRRTAVRVRANDIRPSWDGQLGVTDTSATLPTLDRLFIGLNWQGSAGNTLQGWIESLAIAPTIGLTDAQLQDLSTL